LDLRGSKFREAGENYNEELCIVCSSDVIRVIKSRRKRQTRKVAFTKEVRNAYKV
jgi:hypothetical protein